MVREEAECRLLAFEAMGSIAACDESCAFEKIPVLRDALFLDNGLRVIFRDKSFGTCTVGFQ